MVFRADYLHAPGSTLDVSAITTFIGWTILELAVI
jgi:hypothetical protein